MPVLVTASQRPLARRLLLRFAEEGGEVRAYGTGDAAALRSAGVFVATGSTDDEGRLDAAMADVHTVVHVGPGLLARDPTTIVEEAEVLARAATNAGVRRVIALSLPGVAAHSEDPVRRAKAVEEQLVAAIPVPTIVVRASLVDTVATRDALATGGPGPDVLGVEVAPVRVDDLVELIVAFDRARSQATDGHLVVAADGPARMDVATYLERVGARVAGRPSLLGRRITDDERMVQLRTALLAGPWWSEPGPVLDGWGFAQLEPRPPGLG
jgi:uncharacterized protein YbjT (DUF2867 family)